MTEYTDFTAAEKLLAPYAMRASETRGRRYPEKEHALRSPFQRDRDRIVHCRSFRRLMYKTQVFVTHEGDYFRTRLTHTLEVSQISRTVARILGLNEDLVETVALAHDLGHTPFGHSGEETLNELMADHGGFEHNRHGLRVVEVLERRYPDFPGLNLTYEVRESMAKHTTRHDQPVIEAFADELMPPLEGQIVELADSIAYDSHDLDDAVRAGVVDAAQMETLAAWRTALDAARQRYKGLEGEDLHTQAIRFLIDRVVRDLVATTQANLDKHAIETVDDVRHAPARLVAFSEPLKEELTELEAFLMEKVYRNWRVMRMTNKAKQEIRELFEVHIAEPALLPPAAARRLMEDGPHRTVCDHIAGMTDRYAQDEYRKIFFPTERA
jgi:dGTPase